jgi:hypothetical protein
VVGDTLYLHGSQFEDRARVYGTPNRWLDAVTPATLQDIDPHLCDPNREPT